MTPSEAKPIIEALADGTDPITGEILASESSFNNPQVIRALICATKALDVASRPAGRTSSKPANAGTAWSPEEDARLCSAFDAGNVDFANLAALHGRTRTAIRSRLKRLGKIADGDISD